MLTSNLILDQLWKLDGNVLMNKSNIWKSKDRWNLKSEGSMVLIENVSENKVITRKENVVFEEVLILNDVGQMWENGDPDKEGFFGEYGGKFVPETLMYALEELETTYNKLKDKKDQDLINVANQFEAIFVHQMLKQARQGKLADGIFNSEAQDTFNNMLDMEYSEILSKKNNFGIAEYQISKFFLI